MIAHQRLLSILVRVEEKFLIRNKRVQVPTIKINAEILFFGQVGRYTVHPQVCQRHPGMHANAGQKQQNRIEKEIKRHLTGSYVASQLLSLINYDSPPRLCRSVAAACRTAAKLE